MKLILAAPLLAALLQGTPTPTPAVEVYPPVRHATVAHCFSLPDEVKGDVVRKALADLSTKDADCAIRYGPMKATSRPSRVFVVVEAPASVDVKDVVKALKKGASTVEPMAWTCFQSTDNTLGRGLGGGMPGLSPRDFILGLSNDLRWVEARGGFVEFFFAPGKLSADVIQDRFHKLAQPFGVKDVGDVVVESFVWTLTAPIEAAAARRAEKELAKISGVKEARIDIEKHTLSVKVALENLVRSAPPIAMPGGGDALADAGAALADTSPVPRMRFDTNQIFTVLDKEKLTLAATAKEGEGTDGK
ncbi:MAG: hypothetical protein JNL28_04195 [Planctomycetes bacterium]|nr:hypothetical protein [Planctomycetota bacterium]